MHEDTIVIRSATTYLTIEEAGRKLHDVRLGHGPLRIGRKQDNDVVIQSACVVSSAMSASPPFAPPGPDRRGPLRSSA